MRPISFLRPAVITLGLLGLQLINMRFNPGANWSGADFAIAGTVLLGAGLLIEWLINYSANRRYKLAALVGVVAGLLVMWVNLAVGIIGNENNPVNLLFYGVLAVAAVGALAARLRASGMARAMYAAAAAQFLVPLVGLAIFQPPLNMGIGLVLVFNLVFVGMWALSGWLFRSAGTAQHGANPALVGTV